MCFKHSWYSGTNVQTFEKARLVISPFTEKGLPVHGLL